MLLVYVLLIILVIYVTIFILCFVNPIKQSRKKWQYSADKFSVKDYIKSHLIK